MCPILLWFPGSAAQAGLKLDSHRSPLLSYDRTGPGGPPMNELDNCNTRSAVSQILRPAVGETFRVGKPRTIQRPLQKQLHTQVIAILGVGWRNGELHVRACFAFRCDLLCTRNFDSADQKVEVPKSTTDQGTAAATRSLGSSDQYTAVEFLLTRGPFPE